MHSSDPSFHSINEQNRLQSILRQCSQLHAKSTDLRSSLNHLVPKQHTSLLQLQKSKNVNPNEQAYLQKLYNKTKKRKKQLQQIRKTELGQSSNAFRDEQILQLIEQSSFHASKDNNSYPFCPIIRIGQDLSNQANEWGSVNLPKPRKSKTKFLNFEKKNTEGILNQKEACIATNLKNLYRAQRYKTVDLQGKDCRSVKIKTPRQSIETQKIRDHLKSAGILKKSQTTISLNPKKLRLSITKPTQQGQQLIQQNARFTHCAPVTTTGFGRDQIDIKADLPFQQKNPNLTIGTEKHITFHSLPAKQRFLRLEQIVRNGLTSKGKKQSQKGYYTKSRLQALYQCQMFKIGKKVFGGTYLQDISGLMEELVSEHQREITSMNKRKMSNSNKNSKQGGSTRILQHLTMKREKRPFGPMDANEAEYVLETNKERIRNEKKREISRLRC